MILVKSPRSRICLIGLSTFLFVAILHAEEKTLRISIPKRSKPTPVQALNRDGVKAVEKRDYTKAKKLFYKAYLLDPDDPFTLNNLGYIAELEGDVDRAQRFYQLSQDQKSQATVDRASNDNIKGKTVAEVAGHAQTGNVQSNVLNVQAISLLNKDRVAEADAILQKALRIDPRNPFTLNNMGYTKEKEGELEAGEVNDGRCRRASRRDFEPQLLAKSLRWRTVGLRYDCLLEWQTRYGGRCSAAEFHSDGSAGSAGACKRRCLDPICGRICKAGPRQSRADGDRADETRCDARPGSGRDERNCGPAVYAVLHAHRV